MRKEFLIISRLARDPGVVIAYEELWQHAWDKGALFNVNTLKVHLHRLRHRLLPFDIRIENKQATGYRLLSRARGR